MKKKMLLLMIAVLMMFSSCALTEKTPEASATESEASAESRDPDQNDGDADAEYGVFGKIKSSDTKTEDVNGTEIVTETCLYENGYETKVISNYNSDGALWAKSTVVKKDSIKIYEHSEAYDENGELEFRTYYSFDGEGNEVECVQISQYDGIEGRSVFLNGVLKESYEVKDNELIYSSIKDLETERLETIHYLNGSRYYTQISYPNENPDLSESRDGFEINDTYDKDMNLVKRNIGRKNYLYMPDGRVIMTRYDDPTEDSVRMWLYLGEVDDSKKLAELELGSDGKIIEIYELYGGHSESEIRTIVEDWQERQDELDDYFAVWSEYVYG